MTPGFVSGDSVHFNWAHEKWWRGPGKVLGQDGQLVNASEFTHAEPHQILIQQFHQKNHHQNNINKQEPFNKTHITNLSTCPDSDSDSITPEIDENSSNSGIEYSHDDLATTYLTRTS